MRRFAPFTMPDPGVHNAPIQLSTFADMRNVLKILSLSPEGYRALKQGGRDAVVALSRLHRVCRKSGFEESMIADICALKSAYDAWWRAEAPLVDRLDYLQLRQEATNELRAHAAGQGSFESLSNAAREIATKYRSAITSREPLSGSLVFGMMLAIAAEAEQ